MSITHTLRTVLSKHTVKRLRELVRTRINLSGYSKMAKQDLIKAMLKREELFTDHRLCELLSLVSHCPHAYILEGCEGDSERVFGYLQRKGGLRTLQDAMRMSVAFTCCRSAMCRC